MKKNKFLLNVFHIVIDIVSNIGNYQYHFRLLLLNVYFRVWSDSLLWWLGGVLEENRRKIGSK